MLENKQQKILFFHGFKRDNDHDFSDFIDYLKTQGMTDDDYEIIYFYNNKIRKDLRYNAYIKKVRQAFERNKNYELIIFGYSIGASFAISIGGTYSNVKTIYAILPVYRIVLKDWIARLKKNRMLKKKLIKRYGKERYRELVKNNPTQIHETYPVQIVLSMNKTRSKLGKKLAKIKNKEIYTFFVQNDAINHNEKTKNLLTKKLKKNNQLTEIELAGSHFDSITKKQFENFVLLSNLLFKQIKFVNNNENLEQIQEETPLLINEK